MTTSNETWGQGEFFLWHGAEVVFMPIMMATGIVGNSLVLYIYHFRWRSSTVTLVKKMLAVLDLASLLLVNPAMLYLAACSEETSYRAICVFTSVVALGTAISSGCVLVIIAADRFMRLCQLKKMGVGVELSKKLFGLSLILTSVLLVPCGWTFDRNTLSLPDQRLQISFCFLSRDLHRQSILLTYSLFLGLLFLVVFCTLTVLYVRIIRTLRQLSYRHEELKLRSSITRRLQPITQQSQAEVMRSSAYVFTAVTGVFFASYCPYFLSVVLTLTHTLEDIHMSPLLKALLDLAKLSPLVNSVANPVIYSFTSDHFRREVRSILTFRTCRNRLWRRKTCTLSCKTQELSISLSAE